jgi:hypothetical protein
MTFEEALALSMPKLLWTILQGVERNDEVLQQVIERLDASMITAQDVLDKVTAVKDRTDAETALLDEIHAMLVEAQKTGDQTLLGQAIDQLEQIKQGAAEAIVRNTADDPNPPTP